MSTVETVWQVIGWVSIPVTLLSVVYMVLTWRRERHLSAASLWIPILLSAGSLFLYVRLINLDLDPLLTWLPFIAAFALGVFVGHNSPVEASDGGVVASRNPWSFLVWAASYVATQLVALLAPGSTETMFALLFAATGLTIGEQLALLSARSNQLGKIRTIGAAAAALFLVVALGAALGPRAGFAADVSADLGDVAGIRMDDGNEVPGMPGVTVDIRGLDDYTYSGSSIDVTIKNDTGDTMKVRVPVGTRLYPENTGTQTMLTAGNEVIEVPPGETVTRRIEAYCGEAHDGAPSDADSFTVGEVVTDAALLETLQEMSRQFNDPDVSLDPFTAQNEGVWPHTDPADHPPPAEGEPGHDLYRPPAAGPSTEESGQSGGAVAAVNGGVAIAATKPSRGGKKGAKSNGGSGGSGSIRPISGDDAIARLIDAGHETIEIDGKKYVLPPERLRAEIDGIAFETKLVDGHEVIDRDHVAIMPRSPSTAPADSPGPETDAAKPPATTAKTGVKLSEEEQQRIIDWGVKNNRTPEDIQQDIEAQNETAGGSGPVPVASPPVRVKLGEGRGSAWYSGEEVTLSAEEAKQHRKLREDLKALEPDLKNLRRELAWARIETQKWMAVQLSPETRWLAGTWELIRRANRLDNPGRYLAKLNGAKDVEELLITKYGKPRSRDFVMTSRDYDTAVEAWRNSPKGLEYAENCANIRSQAISDIQSMTSPDPKGATSWFNRPKKHMDAMQHYQDQIITKLKDLQARQKVLTDLERSYADRIRTGPVRH